MKRSVGILLCLGVVIALVLFLRSSKPAQTTPPHTEKQTAEVEATQNASATHRSRPRTAKGDASQIASDREIVDTPAEFARGEMQNLAIVDGAMQLGNDATYVPRFKPYKMFGIYVSPERTISEPIDTVTPNFDVTPFENNEVTLEFRTKSADGNWSTWQEMTQEPNKPMRLEQPAVGWQYRLNLFANEPNNSPKVRSVSLTGKNFQVTPDPGVAFSSNDAK